MMDLHILMYPITDFFKVPKKGVTLFVVVDILTRGTPGSAKMMVVNCPNNIFCRYADYFQTQTRGLGWALRSYLGKIICQSKFLKSHRGSTIIKDTLSKIHSKDKRPMSFCHQWIGKTELKMVLPHYQWGPNLFLDTDFAAVLSSQHFSLCFSVVQKTSGWGTGVEIVSVVGGDLPQKNPRWV